MSWSNIARAVAKWLILTGLAILTMVAVAIGLERYLGPEGHHLAMVTGWIAGLSVILIAVLITVSIRMSKQDDSEIYIEGE